MTPISSDEATMENTDSTRYISARFDPEVLKDVYAIFQTIYFKSQIGPNTYLRILRSLAGVDREGVLWSLGLKTGTWYRQENGQWIPGEPQGKLYLIRKIDLKILCPSCKHVNLASKRFCTNCGAELPMESVTESKTQSPSRASSSIVCKTCGATNATNKKFCTQCGSRLGELAGGTP